MNIKLGKPVNLLCFLVVTAFPLSAGANFGDCNPLDFKDHLQSTTNSYQAAAFYSLLSNEQRADIKNSVSGVLAFVDLLDVSGDLDQAYKTISNTYREQNFDWSSEIATSLATTALTDAGLEAYLGCVNQEGLRIALKRSGDSTVEMVYRFTFPSVREKYEIRTEGSKNISESSIARFNSGGSIAYEFLPSSFSFDREEMCESGYINVAIYEKGLLRETLKGKKTVFFPPALGCLKPPKITPVGINGIYVRASGSKCASNENFAGNVTWGDHRYTVCTTSGTDRYLRQTHNYSGIGGASGIFGWHMIQTRPKFGWKAQWAYYISPDMARNVGEYPVDVRMSGSRNCSRAVLKTTVDYRVLSHTHGKVNWTLCGRMVPYPK